MKPRYTQMKLKRNTSIALYKKDHSKTTLQAIANIYHISKQRVSVILKA